MYQVKAYETNRYRVDPEADELESLFPPDERAAPDYDGPQSMLDFFDYFGN